MQKLIKRLRCFAEYAADLADESKWERIEWEAADLIEVQCKRIDDLVEALERIAGYSMSQFPNRTAMIIEMHHVANDALGIKRGE